MEQEEIIKQLNKLQEIVRSLVNDIEGIKTNIEKLKVDIGILRSKDIKYGGKIGGLKLR